MNARNFARSALMACWSAPRFGVVSYGIGCRIANSATIRRGMLQLGNDVFIGPECFIQLPMRIGNHVMLSARVGVVGGNHRFDVVGVPMSQTGRESFLPVVIEDDVWVGYGAILLGGCVLGRGCIVAAGAVVTRNVPPGALVAGVPARELRRRFASRPDEDRHWAGLR